MELLVVVTLLGIFSSVAAMRFGPTIFGNVGSNTDARRVSLTLLQAQRSAIRSGDNHFVQFTTRGGGEVVSYQLMRRDGSSVVTAGAQIELSRNVIGTVSHSVMEFTFEGEALAAYSIKLTGSARDWRLSVVPVNGTIRTWEE